MKDKTKSFCFWGADDHESPRLYFTACKKDFYFETGSIKENSFSFCPFCGASIVSGRYGAK